MISKTGLLYRSQNLASILAVSRANPTPIRVELILNIVNSYERSKGVIQDRGSAD